MTCGPGCSCEPYLTLAEHRHATGVFNRFGRRGDLWDIEDIVGTCRNNNVGCPYYTAHTLAGNAEIVFCPHSYLLDPAVSQCRSYLKLAQKKFLCCSALQCTFVRLRLEAPKLLFRLAFQVSSQGALVSEWTCGRGG